MTRHTVVALLFVAAVGNAQSPGWRRVSDPQPLAPPAAIAQAQPGAADAYGQPLGQQAGPQDRLQQDRLQQDRLQQDRPPREFDRPVPPPDVPAQLTVQPGTFVTVRVNQVLHSDHNQPGDSFSATLSQPLVVDGIVVAQRGQTVYGRVAEAEKARTSHPSRLALELTGLSLVDGTQATVRSQLVARQGGRAPAGEQAGMIATTTIAGAAVGAAADWGRGAAIGGVIGAAAGTVGVMLTRNHPTIVYPETSLTFRIDSPLTISTTRAPMAFRYVDPYEYNQPEPQPGFRPRPPEPRGYYYGPEYYPYHWGPGLAVVVGGNWYRGGFYGYGRWRRWR